MPSVGSSHRSFTAALAELPVQETTTWPARRRPIAFFAWGVLTLLATAGIAYWLHPGIAAVAFATLVASAIPSLIPTRFSFQAQGILVRKGYWKRRIAWTEIEDVEPTSAGLLLYANGERGLGSALDAFYLQCTPETRSKLCEALEALRDARQQGSSIVRRAERSEVVGSGAR